MAVQYQLIVIFLTITGITMIKLSVVCLYRRLFHISRRFDIYSIALGIILVLWWIAFLFASLFQCGTRLSAAWTGTKEIMKYCGVRPPAVVIAFCGTDLLLDVVVILSPVPIIWSLHINTTRKIQVLGVFALGLL